MKKKIIVAGMLLIMVIAGYYIYSYYIKSEAEIPDIEKLTQTINYIREGGTKYLNEYQLPYKICDSIGLSEPRGIYADGDSLFICDTKNDRLVEIDEDGNVKRIIGETGSEKGQFINPVAMTMDINKNIYVADCGNSRIQVLDYDGNYIDHFIIEKLKDEFYLSSMSDVEVDDSGDIYVSTTNSSDRKKQRIFVIADGKISAIGKALNGVLGKIDGSIIFGTKWEVGRMSAGSGRTFLMEVGTKGIKREKELLYAIGVDSISSYDSYLYIWCPVRRGLDKYDKDFNYLGTSFTLMHEVNHEINKVYEKDEMIKLNNEFSDSAATISKNGTLYVVNPYQNYVYKFERVE